MRHTETHSGIMPSKTKGVEMAYLSCSNLKCTGQKNPAHLALEVKGKFGIRGRFICLDCGHEHSIIMEQDCLQELTCLAGEQSTKLTSKVPNDIKEDIQEAERAHDALCYKACVAMCRRALQLSLIEKGIEDKPLSKMLKDALDTSQEWHLTQDTYTLATTIKTYADIALHRTEKIDSEKARLAIYTAVQMLNELFKQ